MISQKAPTWHGSCLVDYVETNRHKRQNNTKDLIMKHLLLVLTLAMVSMLSISKAYACGGVLLEDNRDCPATDPEKASEPEVVTGGH